MRKLIFIIWFYFTSIGTIFCTESRLVTLSSVKARPLAMGGAYVSLENGVFSLDFNPAAFSMNAVEKTIDFSVYLNPLGPVTVGENWSRISNWSDRLGLFIHGIGFSYDRLAIGILWGEESFSDEDRLTRKCFFDGTAYSAHKNSSIGFSIALNPRVSLGVVGEIFHREENGKNRMRLGYRYGIVIKPRNSLSVGLCFCNFPNDYKEDRIAIERLADETLNIGVSYSPWKRLTMALDIRNVSDDGKKVVREPHAGIEVNPFQFISFRGGYYREWEGDEETFSIGIGLHKWETVYSPDRVFTDPSLRLDASLLWQHHSGEISRWFIMSCFIKI